MIDFDPKTNKAICQMPFNHSATTPGGDRLLCCQNTSNLPICNKQSVEEYWNSDKMKQIRLDMLAGKKRPECTACYEREEKNTESYRQMRVKQNVPDFWEHFSEEELSTGHLNRGPNDFDYRVIQCNLTCVHCGPYYSSSHGKLHYKMLEAVPEGEAPSLAMVKRDDLPEVDSEWDKTLTKEIIDSIERRDLHQIYWAGGEPLMSTMHWDVMEKLAEVRQTEPEWVDDITIVYNTNLTRSTWKDKNAYEFLSQFKKIAMSPSIDGVGNVFNYVRDGGDWDKVAANFDVLSKTEIPETSLSVATVITNLWLLDVDNFMNFFEKYNYSILLQPLLRSTDYLTYLENSDNIDIFQHTSWHGSKIDIASMMNQVHILDPNWFPTEIILPAIDNAIDRVENSTIVPFPGSEYNWKESALAFLKSVRSDRLDAGDTLVRFAPRIKKIALYRDKFKKDGVTFGSVLKEVNTEAWMWYNSIQPK